MAPVKAAEGRERRPPEALPCPETPQAAQQGAARSSQAGSLLHRCDVRERSCCQHSGDAPPCQVDQVLELLGVWVGIKLDQVDQLVDEAHDKVAAIPSQKILWECFGEWLLRLMALEREVAELRAELKHQGRWAS